MIIVLDPRRWLWEGLRGALGDARAEVADHPADACRAAAEAGGGAIVAVCHRDAAEATALASRCVASGAARPLVLCGPGGPAAAPELLGRIVVEAGGEAAAIAAAATLLGLHERALAAEAEAAQCRDLHAADVELIGRVSHDLKSPLAVIRGYLSLILEERYGSTREELLEGLGIVNRRAAQLELLVGQLLDLSRIERGRGSLSIEPVDLAAVVDDVRSRLADEMRERGTTLSSGIRGGGAQVVADRAKMVQIIGNLLSNAIRHGRRGGQVRVDAAAAGASVRLEVGDDGPGVDPANGGAAFQRFFDDPAATGREIGVGLGLLVVRQFVRLHGGRVEVTSEAGRGSTFAIVLPAGSPPEAQGGEPERGSPREG